MFDNDNPEHRGQLIARLLEEGNPAFEWESGGGIPHVSTPLFQIGSSGPEIHASDPDLKLQLEHLAEETLDDPFLFIATNSLRTNCEIGLMGEDPITAHPVSSSDWLNAKDIEDAVKITKQYWSARDRWLAD